MSRQRSRHRRTSRSENQITRSQQNRAHFSDKNHQILRSFYRSPQRRNRSLLELLSNPAERWWIIGISLAAIGGGVAGFFFLPSNLFSRGGIYVGGITFTILGMLLKGILQELQSNAYSRTVLLWGAVVLFLAIIGGAILGLLLLSNIPFAPAKIILGACLGCIGLIVPVALIREFIIHPMESLTEILVRVIEGFFRGVLKSGCCLAVITLFCILIGVGSSLFIWHVFLA